MTQAEEATINALARLWFLGVVTTTRGAYASLGSYQVTCPKENLTWQGPEGTWLAAISRQVSLRKLWRLTTDALENLGAEYDSDAIQVALDYAKEHGNILDVLCIVCEVCTKDSFAEKPFIAWVARITALTGIKPHTHESCSSFQLGSWNIRVYDTPGFPPAIQFWKKSEKKSIRGQWRFVPSTISGIVTAWFAAE